MASLLTHPVVPVAVALAVGRTVVPLRLLLVAMVFSMLPDLDGIGFRIGIPYASTFGHRGFSHSILVALLLAAAALPFARSLHVKASVVFSFLALSALSHGVLDECTNAGKGVAFFWPFSSERIFFGFRPIEASPVSLQRFLSERGLHVLESELVWVWAPLLTTAFIVFFSRKLRRANESIHATC